jgi:hypothetical protein
MSKWWSYLSRYFVQFLFLFKSRFLYGVTVSNRRHRPTPAAGCGWIGSRKTWSIGRICVYNIRPPPCIICIRIELFYPGNVLGAGRMCWHTSLHLYGEERLSVWEVQHISSLFSSPFSTHFFFFRLFVPPSKFSKDVEGVVSECERQIERSW